MYKIVTQKRRTNTKRKEGKKTKATDMKYVKINDDNNNDRSERIDKLKAFFKWIK